jgi:predicted metal-binding protein
MSRKILERVPDELLQQDLERYRQRAIELGATDAKIITTDMILIDERVRAKCIYPKCHFYGTNIHCPPYAMDLELVTKIVNNFHYAIFSWFKVPSKALAGHGDKDMRERLRTQRKNHELVSKIEAEAFYDGYHLALGFANGTCKHIFCFNIECSALVPGQGCQHPLKARASMEGVGMDACTMAARVGWDVYPIGGATKPSEVPYGVRLGLVLIY